MTKIVPLLARIHDDGRIYVTGEVDDPETVGLWHLLHPTDTLIGVIKQTIAINQAARHKGPKPEKL